MEALRNLYSHMMLSSRKMSKEDQKLLEPFKSQEIQDIYIGRDGPAGMMKQYQTYYAKAWYAVRIFKAWQGVLSVFDVLDGRDKKESSIRINQFCWVTAPRPGIQELLVGLTIVTAIKLGCPSPDIFYEKIKLALEEIQGMNDLSNIVDNGDYSGDEIRALLEDEGMDKTGRKIQIAVGSILLVAALTVAAFRSY